MLQFVIHKLLSKKWMVACLLIGIVLLVAITASNPLYTNGVMQKTLSKTLSDAIIEEDRYPATLEFRVNYTSIFTEDVLNSTLELEADVIEEIASYESVLGIKASELVRESFLTASYAVPEIIRDGKDRHQIKLGCFDNLEPNIKLLAGEMYSDKMSDDGYFEVIISERLHLQSNFLVGDTFVFEKLTHNDAPIKIRIVGIFTSSEGSELYWAKSPASLTTSALLAPGLFDQLFRTGLYDGLTVNWRLYLDYTDIQTQEAESLRNFLLERSAKYVTIPHGGFSENLSPYLTSYLAQAKKLDTTLIVLQAPIFILLAAFIFMVSRQLLEMDQNEISVIKSRGAKKKQILQIYLLQGAILSLVGLAIGLPLSFPLCQVLGSSNAFLEFVQRTALPLTLTTKTVIFAVVGALFACAAMVIPAVSYSRLSVVSHKVNKQKRNSVPFWQRIFLDVILLGVSLYAYYSFTNQRESIVQQIAAGGSLDPLLYFSSSIFIVAVGLVGIRILPWLIQLVFSLGKKLWSPALYTAFRRILRQHNSSNFIMLFLVLTIALGIFNARTARSINANSEDQIVYLSGADVVLQEIWEDTSNSNSVIPTFTEPNFDKYYEIEGVESLTKVMVDHGGGIYASSTIPETKGLTLMGINTKEFGETANFDSSLLPTHWYHYLNAISQNTDAILVSSNLKELGFETGDSLRYYDSNGCTYYGTIYAFVDYWPSYTPISTDKYLIVSHLSYLQSVAGIQPYQIWLKMEDSTQPVYDFATNHKLTFQLFNDTSSQLIELKNDPVFQGTNGVLTSNFVIVLLLCTVGFLIFWILSVQSRVLQFGIFRAMGLSMREILTMLIGEQVMITGTSIGFGILAGNLATLLYMPLIQLSYISANQILPLKTVSELSDSITLFSTVGCVIVVCMVILGMLISKIKIVQALKLGED